MNYYKLVKSKRMLYGTLSVKRTALKMLNGVNPDSLHRYGNDLYEQAWKYYITTHISHKYFLTRIILSCACLGFSLWKVEFLPIAAIISTAIVYDMRGVCK